MTPEALEQLVKDGPDEKLVGAMAPLSETERKALSKTAQRLRRETKDGTSDRDRACLAIFGVASLSSAKRVTLWELGRYAEARPLLVKVLTDRKPGA
jgi:hypothetical protein